MPQKEVGKRSLITCFRFPDSFRSLFGLFSDASVTLLPDSFCSRVNYFFFSAFFVSESLNLQNKLPTNVSLCTGTALTKRKPCRREVRRRPPGRSGRLGLPWRTGLSLERLANAAGQKSFRDRKGTPEIFCDKDFAELSGELSGAIDLKSLVFLGRALELFRKFFRPFVRFFGFGFLFWPSSSGPEEKRNLQKGT